MPKERVTPSQRRLFLLYHELRAVPSRYSYVTESAVFEKHVDVFVPFRAAENSGMRPEITFDDGHISNFEYALPILQARSLQARFFITVGWTGNRAGYMGWRELRSLHEAGQAIGAHGWSHTLLTHCSDNELEKELGGARRELEDGLGASITTMSLPGGRYNRRVLAACEQAGYTEVYSSIPRAEAVPLGSLVGRLNIRGDMSLEWISRLFQPESKILSRLERQYRLKATAKGLLGDSLYEKLWARLNRKEKDGDDHAEPQQ